MADDNWLNNSRAPTRQIGFNDMNLKRLFLQSITSWYERFFTFYKIDIWITEFPMPGIGSQATRRLEWKV